MSTVANPVNVNGHVDIGSVDDSKSENHPSNHVAFPSSEEEATAMMIEAFNRDPEKIRKAAKDSYDKMMQIANEVEGNKPTPDNNVIIETKNSEPIKEIEVKQVQQVIKTPPTVIPPQGYLETPEGLYTWSPDIWGGRPLQGVPDRVIEKEGRATLIVFIVVSPCFGRNRNGRVVSLPEGARIVVHASIAWAPIIGLAKGPEGRPVIWAAPTTVDNLSGKIRIAEPGDKLHIYETGDGGKEYGLSIMYDPDPKDSTKPRLISLETLRGVG